MPKTLLKDPNLPENEKPTVFRVGMTQGPHGIRDACQYAGNHNPAGDHNPESGMGIHTYRGKRNKPIQEPEQSKSNAEGKSNAEDVFTGKNCPSLVYLAV